MIRHVAVTALIIVVIYTGLLWINKGRFPAMSTWSDYTDYAAGVSPDWTGRAGAALGETIHDENDVQPSNEQPPTRSDDALRHGMVYEKTDTVLITPAVTITGVVATVDLSDPIRTAADVNALWKKFANKASLHEIVSWANGSNPCYAYYHSFDKDIARANLIIGYASDTGGDGLEVLTTQSGPYTRYEFNASGTLPDEVWVDAYPDGVILERYELSASGDQIDGHAVVIK